MKCNLPILYRKKSPSLNVMCNRERLCMWGRLWGGEMGVGEAHAILGKGIHARKEITQLSYYLF